MFLFVAFGVTWALWLPLLVDAEAGELERMPWTFFLASIGPLCGAVAAALWEGGWNGLRAWVGRSFSLRFRWVWWLAGIGLPVAYFAIAWATSYVVAGTWPDLAQLGGTDKLPGLPAWAVAGVWIITFGVGEESGWRGWLLPAVSRQMSVFWAALVVAGVWIVWHVPAFFFNPTYAAMGWGILGWMLALVCGSCLLAWMTVGAHWSIVPVLLWHAGFDLLTAADQSAGIIASTISAVVMMQGAVCAWLLIRRSRIERSSLAVESAARAAGGVGEDPP